MPDSRLVQLMAEGDREACAELRERHGLSVYAQLYVALGRAEPAEQLVTETFDQAWRAAGALPHRAGSVLVRLSSVARAPGAEPRAIPVGRLAARGGREVAL